MIGQSQASVGGNDKTNELLVVSGLQAIIQKYGTVSVLGIHPPKRKGMGTLDIQVACTSCDNEEFQKIFNEIGRSASFSAFYSGEKDIADLKKKYSSVRHMSMSKVLGGKQWEVNVWFVSNEEAQKVGGAIDIPRQKRQKLSSFRNSDKVSGAKHIGILVVAIYIAIVIFIFFGTLAIFNKLFNEQWGLNTLSSEVYEIPEDAKEEDAAEEIVIKDEIIEETVEDIANQQVDSTDEPSDISATTEKAITIDNGAIKISTTTPEEISEEAPEDVVQDEVVVSEVCEFNNNLRLGDNNDDVAKLQTFLNTQEPYIYPEGIISGYFGELTKSAVIRFQEAYNIPILSPWEINEGTGFVGTTTRAKINEICSQS